MIPRPDSPNPTAATFARNGYVALAQFLDNSSLADLRENLRRFLADILPSLPPHHVFYEDKSDPKTLKQIQQMFAYDPFFHDLLFESRFREIAVQLLGSPVIGKNLQYFNKPPGLGQATPPHQDGFYFMLDPCEAVTMWLALDDVDEENGCVRYVPGSHQGGLLPHQRTQTLGFSQGIPNYNQFSMTELAAPAHPGDLLVHHALTIHRADPNRSPTRHRRALGLIYYSVNAREDKAAQEAYQMNLARELAASGKI